MPPLVPCEHQLLSYLSTPLTANLFKPITYIHFLYFPSSHVFVTLFQPGFYSFIPSVFFPTFMNIFIGFFHFYQSQQYLPCCQSQWPGLSFFHPSEVIQGWSLTPFLKYCLHLVCQMPLSLILSQWTSSSPFIDGSTSSPQPLNLEGPKHNLQTPPLLFLHSLSMWFYLVLWF